MINEYCSYWSPFQADEISHVIAELEKSIARYKEEYAALISQAQAIKADLAAVEAKVRWQFRSKDAKQFHT